MTLPESFILATGNRGKQKEFLRFFEPLGITIYTLDDYGIQGAEETGISFIENAIIKARHASSKSGLPAFADDSGLEVDALNGKPGIYSARYAGLNADAQANNRKLLDALASVPPDARTARFRCVIAYLRNPEDPAPIIAEGQWEGHILTQESGTGGFGYDPLFLPQGFDISAAQLPLEEKNQISHRGQALTQLRRLLALP